MNCAADRLLALLHRDILAVELPGAEARLEILAQHHCDAAFAVAGAVVGHDADALGHALVVDEDRHDDGMGIDRGAAVQRAVFQLQRAGDVVLLVVIGEGDLAQAGGFGCALRPVAEALELDRDRAAIGAAGDDRGGAVGDQRSRAGRAGRPRWRSPARSPHPAPPRCRQAGQARHRQQQHRHRPDPSPAPMPHHLSFR